MLFREIGQNYSVYILNRNEMTVTEGKITSVGFPRMSTDKTGKTQMVRDAVIEVNGTTATYQIPDEYSIIYAGNLVLATENTGLIKEIESIKNTSDQIVASYDKEKERSEKAAALLSELNPAYREKKEIDSRFNKIESSMSSMQTMLETFIKEFKTSA